MDGCVRDTPIERKTQSVFAMGIVPSAGFKDGPEKLIPSLSVEELLSILVTSLSVMKMVLL